MRARDVMDAGKGRDGCGLAQAGRSGAGPGPGCLGFRGRAARADGGRKAL